MSTSSEKAQSPPKLLRDSIHLVPSLDSVIAYAEAGNDDANDVMEPLEFESVTGIHNVKKLASYGYEYGYKDDQLSPRGKL